jgi:uncharacterized protein (DUF362 family)
VTRIDRRQFLKGAAIAGVALGSATVFRRLREREPAPWDPAAFPPVGSARVAVLSAPSYRSPLTQLLLDGLREIGADVQGASVLLKPNFVEFDVGSSVNTDPRLVAAAVLAFRRLGAREVTVAEGPGHRRDTSYVVRRSGLTEALRDADAPFVDLNVGPVRPTTLRSSYTSLGRLWLPKAVTDADVVVSMPKMKMHHWAGVTLSLKNCFGCVPGRVYGWPKNALHFAGVEPSILDVAAAVRPDLAIVDAIVAMEGNGPITGDAIEMGALVVGDDPVATDVVAASMMGVDPQRVPYLVEAGRFLGQGHPEQIEQRGEDPAAFTRRLTPAPGFSRIMAS